MTVTAVLAGSICPNKACDYQERHAFGYFDHSRYEEALAAFTHSRDRAPDAWFPYIGLVLTAVQLGREGDARVAAAELLRREPMFSLERYATLQPYQNPADLTHELDILRQGGLK